MRGNSLLLLVLLSACQPPEDSGLKVTAVKQTPVKQQAIGNCWVYAQATWLESLLKSTTGQEINVSETYWTYWDLYTKLLEKQPVPTELNAGGSWSRSASIIREHGWVEEVDLVPSENLMILSQSQLCAEEYILEQGKEGGTLYDLNARTPEHIREELDKAFSCRGTLPFDMNTAVTRSHKSDETMIKDVKTGVVKSLSQWMSSWQEILSPSYTFWGPYEGKKLGIVYEFDEFRKMEQRIKSALNDHQPVMISFYVSFNAPDTKGLFNLDTLAQMGEMGEGGGHMIVLHDYTVKNVPTEAGLVALGEGDMAPEMKAAALKGDLDYLVAKNSWGYDRPDRPWLNRDGYSRFTWDYLMNRYYNEESGEFAPFLRTVILPPGY